MGAVQTFYAHKEKEKSLFYLCKEDSKCQFV